ncbi:leucine-rich repeat transmembrane protein CCDC168 [Panthera uncia]|uniref:leucine-rich repeat transmembrane protein CCDC168 n=1 Tax=Panthera uncia TaxID=29064 RepID=UPI0020FF9FE3|nr:leucine-rich repeat transmembrane protein CCDC168 [Panthera uncia]
MTRAVLRPRPVTAAALDQGNEQHWTFFSGRALHGVMRWAHHLFVFWSIQNRRLQNETSTYFTYYIKMSTEFYFFKRAVRNRLEDNTFLPLWELVESWTQNDWMAIFFIIFLGIIFEIILIKIYTSFHKKPVLPEKGSSGAQEKEDCCLKSMKFDNWSIRSSSPSEERVDEFSVRTITSSLKTEDKEGNFEDRVSPTDEVIWSGTSESKYQVSCSSESRMPSSHGTSSSLSLFHSEVKEFFLSHRGYEKFYIEHETAQFSSRKLFAILKTNKNKNPAFSSDFDFSRRSSISRESEGLDMAPCPPAHLFLSRDQVRLLEETVRNQIPLKPKTILESKTTYPYSRPQESLIQNQHSFGMHIPTQAQDSFPVQNAIQNQGFYEARFTSQAQQFVNNQESVNSQPDIMARYFALPQDLIRKPFSSSTQDSFQTQVMGRSQHLVNVPHSVETQHSIKGLESDNKHLHETQYSSVWFEDSNQIKHLTQGQNAIFKNARFLVLTVSPNSFAEGMLQIRSVKPEGQKQIASSELNQYSVYSSVPLSLTFKRQKNWRKALHGKSKLSCKVSSQKSKKPTTPWVFQMTVCHTSKPGKLGCKYNAKKKELHPRKGVSDIALHLLYFSKLVPPYIKRYSRKKLVEVMPGVTGRRHSLLKQNKSLDAENVSCVGSVEKRGTSGNAKNVKQHGRENEGQKNISAKLPSWLEESFMVNTFPLKAPCSLLIETNWKNKQSLKDPITQEKEIGIAEFHAPNSKKTSDLHIPKREAPLEEAISEPWQKFASSPEMESNRRMKTQEDLKSTENSHLPLSNGEELPTNSPETQRCFPNRNIQKEKDFLEIVLETSEVNLLISLGTKEHKSSEQVASVKTQESTEDTVMKEKKPLILHVTECDDPSESERLQCNTRSNINMQDKSIFATFHNATDTTISGPPDMEMRNRLKAKTDTSTAGFSYSVVEQEKLPDEKKASDAKYIEERCIKKPQEHDREEEEPTLQEAVPQLKQDFRVSLQLKQKPKYVRFEIKQSSSGSRKNPNKEQEVQPQTLSTETIVGTGSCPTMDPFQVQVKQITDRPTGRETADAKNPLTVLENSPVGGVLTDTTERDVPFGGSPRKIPDDHIAEEKEDLKRVFPAAALGLFIIRSLPLSSFKRQKIRRKWSGAKTVLGPKLVVMKVKKPANLLMPNISRNGIPSLRRRLRGNFKIITKQILQDKIVSDVLVNVTYPHMSTVPRIRTHSRLNAENPGHTKPNQEESEDEREEKHSNFISKGNDSGNTPEEAKLQDEVRGDEAARPEAVLHGPWQLRLNANPEKEFKTEEEMPQPVTSGESLVESVYTPIMDLFHVENMKKSLATQADLKRTADAEIPLPTSGKSVIGDPLNQTRESDVLDYGNDTREMGYFFADTKAELPKDLPAMYSETFNCHMPVSTHSKVNKNRVRFSHIECPVKPKSVPTNTVKPSVSQVFNSTGHRKKLDSEVKAKWEKINQANGLVYDFISSLFSPMHSRLQGETNSFCHAQLKQGQLAEEVRPRYVDFFDKCSAFHDQEEKVKDREEVEQKTLLEAASQHTQRLWPDACQGKETHLDEQYTALGSLTQGQDAQHQTWFAQTALQTSLQMAPREGEELEKPSQTEHAITAPMGAESPPPKAEKSSFDNIFNTMTECDLPSGGNPKRVLDSHFVENNSELPKDLQVTCLHSSGSVEPFVSKSERKENTLELARKQITANHRYRTIRGKKPSASHMLNGTQSKGLQCNFKTKRKKPQQNKNAADAFLNIIQSRVPILPNTKMSSGLNVETDMQRVTGLDYMQLMQEKLLNGGKVCCPDHIMSTLSNSMKDGKEEEGKHEVSPAPENSQSFIFNAYQKENFDLVQSDEELKQPRSRNLQVQPQMHGTQTVLSYASCPILDQLQFGELESYAGFSPPKSEEVKNDEIVFSAREHGVPSDANHQKEQAGGVEKKDTVTFDFCLPALSTPQRNFKYSDKKTSVNTKYGLLKAKKRSVSNIFNIKGAVSSNHRKELGCNPTTKMKEVHHGEKMAAKMYSFMTITPDINTYNKIEREKDMLGERSLRAKQVKQATSPLEGNITSDDTKENSVQDEEEETGDQEILKVISQHSTHFKFCSGQREELDLHQSENQRSGKILFVIEQDIPQQMQPTDSMLGEKPNKSHHPQNGAICIASSKLPPLKSKDSLIGQVLVDTVKGGVPSVGSHMGELYHHGKEENAEFKKNLETTVLEYSEVSRPDLSESKRQRKTFTCRALKNQMSPKCVIMKARKTPISTIFSISGNGCLKNLPPKTLKSQNIDFLIHTKCSGVPEDLIAEKKEGLAQEFPATILESLDLATLALPALKRRRNHLKYIEERKKMSLKWVTLKTKKPPISQTLRITKRGIPSHRRQYKCNFSIMMKQGKSVADKTLNAVSSPMPVSLDMKMHNRIKAESDVLWTMRFSHERQQQELSPDGERASGAFSSDKRGCASRGMKEVKGQREEAAPRSSQHFSSITGKMEEPRCVRSELELENSARKKIPEPLNTTQEQQQQTLFTQSVLHCVSCTILNSLPVEKLPKRTKAQKGLKYAKSPKLLSPDLGKSVREPLIITTQSDIPSERGPRKELARSIPEGKRRLQKDLQGRTLKFLDFSTPASSDFRGWRKTPQIPKSRTGKAQMASILKTIHIASSAALSHGKEQDCILENMAPEISQGMSDIFTNTYLSHTPVSPAIKTHQKIKAKKDPLRNKSSISQLEQHEGEKLCPYSSNNGSNSSSTSESRWQSGKEREGVGVLFEAGLHFLCSTGRRKDQNMFITEQEVQRQTVVSENKLESTCPPLIPLHIQELRKNIPPQKDIPHRLGQKIPCPKSGTALLDYFSTDGAECSAKSDASPARKLDVHMAVSLRPGDKGEGIKTHKVVKHRVDQNIPPTKSGNSVLGDPGDGSSRRKMSGRIARKHRELHRDLLTTSTTSVFSDSIRQEKVLKFPGRKNLTGPKCVTMKAKKPLCSQMLHITKHDNLYCRKEQDCNLKSSIKDKQQNKSIANAFLSPAPVSADNKIDIEMQSTSKAEIDQLRVNLHSHIPAKRRKSTCDREAWNQASSTDMQNRSSKTMKMNVQHEKEEENIQRMLLDSVPHCGQHHRFSADQMKNPGSSQSTSELNNSEVRRTWNLPWTAQKMRQEECFRETVSEPVSRHMMTFLQVETEKKGLSTQEGIKCMERVKTPLPKARKSETASIQCGTLWDGNPRRHWDSPILGKKAWNQNDLVRTVLKPSDFSSLDSSVPKSQSYALDFVSKRSIVSSKHVTLKAKKRPSSQLLNTTRCITGSHRKKKGCTFQYKMKGRQWIESVVEASLPAAEGTEIPPSKTVTDKHSFDTIARSTIYNRTLHKNLRGHTTEEKAELGENSATTFLGPLDFFTPILSDPESQKNTVQLLEEKITLNINCSTMKKKELAISQILKIRRQFTTKYRNKPGSNLKTKMKQMRQDKNVANTFPNTIDFTPDTPDLRRQSRLKTGIDRGSQFRHTQPTHTELPTEGLVISQLLHATSHAALSNNERQEKKIGTKREKTVLRVDLKSVYDSMPIFSHIKMDPSPSTWGISEESSEKGNALNKANASSAYACTPVYLQIVKHKAMAKTADVKNSMHTKRIKLKAKKLPVSQLCHTIGCRTRRNKKEQTCNMKKQKREFWQDKTVTDVLLSTICDSGSVPSQIKQFTEVKREKDRPRKPLYTSPQRKLEKSLSQRKMSSSESTDIKNTISRNIKTLKQYIRAQKENCQTLLLDILPQCRDQLVIGQQVTKELDPVKIGVTLEREVYPGLSSQKRDIDYPRFDAPRVRKLTGCEFLVAQRVKEEDIDMVERLVSIPSGKQVSEKTDASLSSKGQNIFLTELNASQQKTCKEQELPKQGSVSVTNLGSVAYPIMETSRLENTGKVAEEEMYTSKKNISHLLGREDIEETDIFQGSKGQKFLYTNLVAQQNISAVQKGEVEPDDIPDSTVDSVSCPNRDNHFQITQVVNTRKEDVSVPINLYVNPWRKEQSQVTDSPLRLNEKKMIFSEKLKAKQLHRSNQNKENILESISSRIVHQLHNNKLMKNVSAKGRSSKVLSSVVDEASNKADTPVDQPPCSEGVDLHNRRRKEPQKASTCKALPTSVSYSLTDVLQMKLPCVKEVLKAPMYRTSNTEGIGLPVEGKEEKQPECIHQISPKPASHSSRDIFQSKMPCKEKASKEVVSTMDYIPSTEQIGSFITRQDSKVRIGKGKPCMKLTSLCASLPSLPHTDVNSRIEVGQGKSGILKSCLLPLKSQVSSSVRKTLFAKSINRDSLSRVIESKHLPQGKKEDGENIVYVKDIMGLKCVTFKGKKTPFKYILHGKEPQWNNKEQEETMQKDKNDLDMVQNKHHASFPSSPHLEWMPGIKEVLMRGIAGFCLPSLTLKELSDAMGVREEPTDDILSSIKKAKYMPRRDRVEMALEEIVQPKRIALKVKQSPITQELQLNIKENEKNMQEHKDNQVGIRNTSCISISFPSYSEVDIRITGEETRLIKRRSSFLQPELQESSDIEKIAYKESVYGDISSSINKAKEHIMQEEEERVKKEEVIPFREKKSPISQETQLDIEEQETKVQKIKDEPNVLVSNTSPCIIAPSHLKLGTRIKTADSLTEVARYCIPELSHQKSSDAVKKANKESIDDDATSDVQEAKDYVPQKEESDVEISAERDVMHPKDKDLKRKQALSQDIPPDLKEQVNVDPESEEQGRMEGGGKGEREVVLPTHGASESSLSHHELDTRIEGEEDSQGITRPAVSQLQLQKSFEAGKTAYTKSTGDDISKDLRVVQEYEPEKGEDGRKIVNMKYLMYPKGTTSKEKVLPLPHVLYTSGSCGSQIVEVQTNMKEKLGNLQERSKLDKLLTRTSLLPFKLNKGIGGKEEKEGVTRPSLPPSWHKESSHAEELKYTVPPLNGITSSSKRTEYMTQTEEDKANNFEEDIMHPRYIALRAKKSPLFLILKTKKLQVNIKEQGEVGQEDNEDTVVLLSRIHPFITSSTHLKWDTIKDEEGEPGIIRNDVPHLELQESLPSGRMAPTESSDSHVIKEEQHPRQEERNRVQTEATDGSMRPSGTDCKAKISPPPPVFRVTEHSALNNRKEPQWSMMEKVEQEQQRTGDPDVAQTKTPPSTLSPPHHSLDTRTKENKDSLAMIGCSPSQLLCPESSDAGKPRHADSNEGIGSFDVIIKINQPMPYTKVKNRVKIKDGEGRRFPKIITLRAEISSLLHLSSRKRLPLYIKEQGKEVQEGKSEPEMVLKEACASLPSPSYLKWDRQMNEKEDTLEKTHFTFPPSKIQDPSNSGKEAYTKSFYGELKEKDRLKIDIEDKMVPRCMALKAKEVPLSHILDTKKLQWKMKEQERKMQKKKNDLVENLGNICTSLLTLPYLKFGKTEGEGYMIRITNVPLPQLQSKESLDAVKTAYAETTDGELSNDVKELKEHTLQKEVRDGEKNMEMNSTVAPSDRHLKEKRSPILLRYNLSDHPWKTKDQEGMAQEGQREPGGTIPTKTCTCTCRSSLLHLYKNPRCEKKRMAILTRSSLSPVNFQESSDSEDVESVEPTARDILISPQKGKDQMPQNKEGDGVETVNLMFPKHQEKKIQGSKDEPGVVLANTSSPSSSLPLLQLDKEIQVDDEMLVATRSVVQRVSNAREIVHTEGIGGDVLQDSQNAKQCMPQEEEQDREKTNMKSMAHITDIILKSKKSPPSRMLHRTELHLIIGGQEPKKHEGQGKPPCTVLRKIYVSKHSANPTLDKGTQVNEKMLGIRRPSLLPCMLSALSGAGAIRDVRERKQHMSQKEKKYEVKTVDMRIRMQRKEARISSISHIFNTKEFVLNIKEQKENMCKGKDELPIVLTRTFLSIPSAPALYLDSGNKIDKDVPGATGSSPLQQNLQESSDTQKTAITEVVAGDSEIVVKKVKHSVPQEETVQQWTSNFTVSVQQRNEPPRVKSEGDLSLLVLNSQHEDIYLTGFHTISGKRLEYFFTGQEALPEKYKTETFTTFLSYPTMDPAKMANLKKETEIMDDLNHERSPKSLVSPPRKISKEIYVTFGTPVCAKGFSVSEQDAPQQKTLSKASPGSGNSYTSDKPEKEVQNHDKMSKMPSSKALALQTKGSLEKMNITESDTPPIIEEQEIVVKKQVVLQSERGHKTCLDSSLSLKLPLKDGRQKTQLETDVCKQTMVYPRIQILPGTHVDITVFDTLGGKKEQALLVPEQKECILESCQKPLPSHWTFPVQSEDLEGKNKMDTSTIINLEQKTLELEEGELKIDTNIAICLEKDKTEMHKHIIVSLEENLKRDTNNVVNGSTPSPKAEESQINTQVITRIGNSCPIKQKHKKDLEVPGAKQNIQPRKMFQKHILDSFYAYIPLSLKFEGQKGRLTIADLKRELSPKYLTMKIQNHPISQILNNTGHGIPSNRKKLEYDFSGPKKTVLWREDTSGICIRSLSISTVNSSQTEETAESETNLEREKILCLSEFQQKSPSTSDIKRNSSSIVKEGCPPFSPLSKSETNLSREAKENILIPQTKEENVVPGPDSSRIIKEPYLLMTEEEEKAPKPILMPTECPLMSDDPKDSVETHMESTLSMNISPPGVEETQYGAELLDIMGCASPPEQGDQSEPIQDTTTPKVQQQKTFPGSGPVPSQVKSNEIKVVAERTSAESLLPLYEAVKNILESQIKNMIQDKICEDILEKIKAHKPDAWKSPSFAGSPDTTSTTKPPTLQPKLILERLLPKENNKLTNHLESKAFEIRLNLIPEIAKKSFHKFNFYLKQSISEHNSWRLYPRHKKMCFLSLEGIDGTEPNLNQKYPKDSPPVRCMKTLIVNVSSDGKEIIANRKSIRKLESGASSVTSANEMPLTPILPNYSAEEKDKLFVHFSIKTLEIQMTAFPRIVRESFTMANAQNTKKPLSKFVNSGTKVPKRKNKILLLFKEKSLHQIDLDLQYKYLHFLLGLPVKSMFPKPNALPKHILKLNTVAICKNRDYRGESGGGLCIDTEPLEHHISSEKQSPHENSSLMKKFLKPTHVCASNADQQGTAQKDSTVLSELKSHVTPEKDKQCHVWFQETNTYKYFDPKTQESAPHLVDSHSIPISEDSAESQTNIESLANLEACSALEVYGSKECMFLEANPYLSQESQNILFELQKGIPLENLYKMRKSKTNLKPFYREYSGSHHGVRGCRKHSSIVTPSYESHKSRKYGSSDTTPFPDWLCYGSLNTVDVPSSSSSVPFSEGKSSWSAGHRTNYSLVPLTESNIKLHLAKSQGKPYSHLESKERKKAKLDLFTKNNLHWDCDYSYTQNKEKFTRKKKVCNYESERLNHYASKPKLSSKPHREDVYFHSESKQNQPFFYACIPADSLEIMPQTIRWTIPPRTLKKTNFRVPLVAKISSSCNIWTSSKKLLGSLLESFSPVHPN